MPFTRQLTHLTALAQVDGWKAYCWHRSLELQKDPNGLYLGLSDSLKAAMTKDGQVSPAGSDRPILTKPA